MFNENAKLGNSGTGGGDVSTGYFTHCYAPQQSTTDSTFFDLLGVTDGSRGANLSISEMWANAGYATTKDPVGATVATGIAYPPLAWDWAAGESLLIFWKGKCTPEGAATSFMGQSASAAQAGIQIRAQPTGQAELIIRHGDGINSSFLGSTPNTAGILPFVANEEHSLALLFDPVAGRLTWYVDGSEISTGLISKTIPTYNATDPFRIGSASKTPSSSDGIATQSKAFIVLKGRYNQPAPNDIANIVRKLHRAPWRSLMKGVW